MLAVWLWALVGLSATACDNLPLDELLAGKACDSAGRCADGYVCDPTTQICVRPGASVGAGGEGGSMDPCMSPGECPAPGSSCQLPVCVAGQCGISPVPMGTEVPGTNGDCRATICDGLGESQERNDTTDAPDDANPCTIDGCNGGTVEHTAVDPGEACGDGLCDGSGTCVECLQPSDCVDLPPDDECGRRVCADAACSSSFTPDGTLVAAQSSGDCVKRQCDGQGNTVAVPDDQDVPDDGNPCTADGCSAGAPTHTPLAAGSACGVNGVCDGAGSCTGCVAASDCGTDTFCTQYACNAGTCLVTYTASGVALPAAQQSGGDCQELRCNGMGGVDSANTAGDVPPDDGNDCTDEVCVNGSPQHPAQTINAPCASGGGSFCDGAGACVECTGAGQCSAQGGVCQTAACDNGACGLAPLAAGTPAPMSAQTDGDCQRVVCNGAGGIASEVDDADLPTDAMDCTLDQCNGGMPSNPPAPMGASCGAGGTCDANGNCITAGKVLGDACGGPSECQSGHCVDGVCCDSTCDAICTSCLSTNTQAPEGTCTSVAMGTDPDGECTGGQVCDGGGTCSFQCGQNPTPPAGTCPAACTGGCAGGTCLIDCTSPGSCTGSTIDCPSGFACEVQCDGPNGCKNATVECPALFACDIVCNGDCSAMQVMCGAGTCNLACSTGGDCSGTSLTCGANACEATCVMGAPQPAVSCGSSCACTTC